METARKNSQPVQGRADADVSNFPASSVVATRGRELVVFQQLKSNQKSKVHESKLKQYKVIRRICQFFFLKASFAGTRYGLTGMF